ncbi:acyltransferase, partial [Streptomyces sp. NPDC017529]
AVAMADVHGTPTVLRSRCMQWLGEVSFGFYLAQHIVLFYSRETLMGGQLFGTPAAIGIVAALFLVALLVGWLLLVCVERPVMRRWARPRKPPLISVPPPAEAVDPPVPSLR